jgi:hypothetical protein
MTVTDEYAKVSKEAVMAIVRLEGLRQLINSMTSSEIEPATFRLVA